MLEMTYFNDICPRQCNRGVSKTFARFETFVLCNAYLNFNGCYQYLPLFCFHLFNCSCKFTTKCKRFTVNLKPDYIPRITGCYCCKLRVLFSLTSRNKYSCHQENAINNIHETYIY